jgi:hypothetical protein
MDITHALHRARITPAVTDGLEINLTLGPLAIVAYLGDVAAEELGIEACTTSQIVCQAHYTFGHDKRYRVELIGYAVGVAPSLIDPQPVGKEGNWRK